MDTGRCGTASGEIRSVDDMRGGFETLSRFFAATTALSSADTADEALTRTAHAARRLTCADYATVTRLQPEPGARRVAGVGHHTCGIRESLERPLAIDGEPFAIVRIATSRERFTASEQALLDLLCVHASLLIENISLRDRDHVLRKVRALLGEQRTGDGSHMMVRQAGDVRLDVARHEAFVADHRIHLTPSEFRLLELLTEETGRVYTRAEILSRLWDTEYDGSPRVADAHVARLRRKIERDPLHPERLVSIRGLGYKLVPGSARPDEGPLPGRTRDALDDRPGAASGDAADSVPART